MPLEGIISVHVKPEDIGKLNSLQHTDTLSFVKEKDHILILKNHKPFIEAREIHVDGTCENSVSLTNSRVSNIKFMEQDVTKGSQIWVVDEASMIGNRQMYDMAVAADRVNAKVVLVGDTKQLPAIEAGRIFSRLQEDNVIDTVYMKEVLRQKSESYRSVVEDVSDKKIDRAFESLGKNKSIVEIPCQDKLKTRLTGYYTSGKIHEDSLIVTLLNRDRKDLNSSIRHVLQLKKKLPAQEYVYTTRESRSYHGVKKHFAQSYKQGNIITINKGGCGIKVGEECRVVGVNTAS
jgi:ATP-dependent exoDNAse (exonuclease V) alpha subunit